MISALSLLPILVALTADRALPNGSTLGKPHLLRPLLRGLDRSALSAAFARSAALPWVLTLLAVALTAATETALQAPLWNLLFSGAVLFLCLGPRDLADDIQRLLSAREHGDQAEVERLARGLQHHNPAPNESHRTLLGALFIQSHERLFGVLLWFIALGPAGAVLYRVASRLPMLLDTLAPRTAAAEAAAQLHATAAWLPARATAGLFALAGSMDDAMRAWHRIGESPSSDTGPGWRNHTWAVLADVASGSLAMEEVDGGIVVAPDLGSALREVLRMQSRALLILLAVLVVFTTGTLI